MKTLPWAAAVAAVVVSGCATTSPETISCLQPNRRVVVEVGGQKPPPPPKKPGAKRGKPQNVMLRALAQGDSAWDYGKATLKDGGKAELDRLVNTIHKGAGRDKRPTTVKSIIITGHVDRTEAGNKDLDEQRARAVRDYLVSKGLDAKLMFWEGRDAADPMPVTKFCAS